LAVLRSLLFLALIFGTAIPGASQELSSVPTETLINRLANLDTKMPGIDDTATWDFFAAEESEAQFLTGLIPNSPPPVPPHVREIVRRGALALPELLKHLTDARPTKIRVGNSESESETVGGQFFGNEYYPRDRTMKVPSCDAACPSFEGQYVVKIGDVCQVLIGQIVNRRLHAVRYQPTLIVFVNSPIETPTLAEWIRKDWSRVNERALMDSLLADLRAAEDVYDSAPALRRLRFYFPETYASLRGSNFEKRRKFEESEAAGQKE
jgi:hypothetical protein